MYIPNEKFWNNLSWNWEATGFFMHHCLVAMGYCSSTLIKKVQTKIPHYWVYLITLMSIVHCPGICDGAAAVMVASEEAVKEHNLTPLARCDLHLGVIFGHWNFGYLIYSCCTQQHSTQVFLFRIVGYGVAGCEPTIMGIGPVPSIQAMLEKTGVSMG